MFFSSTSLCSLDARRSDLSSEIRVSLPTVFLVCKAFTKSSDAMYRCTREYASAPGSTRQQQSISGRKHFKSWITVAGALGLVTPPMIGSVQKRCIIIMLYYTEATGTSPQRRCHHSGKELNTFSSLLILGQFPVRARDLATGHSVHSLLSSYLTPP